MKKAVIAGVLAGTIALAGCGGGHTASGTSGALSDGQVKSDLASLLDPAPAGSPASLAPQWQVSSCAHQNGSQYVCQAWKGNDTRTVQVTDDGTNVYEQGIGPNE